MTTRRVDHPGAHAGSAHPGGGQRPGVRARGGALLPGGVVGDGRYRLLAQFGVDQRGAAHLWRARDGQLRRDVALTIIIGDPSDTAAVQDARKTLDRAAHAARFSHPAVSRVLDVLTLGNGITATEGVLGMVVADWAQGTDLVDLIAEHPLPPATAIRLIEPLATAVEQAHHQGLVLGVDHPQRIRVGGDGMLRLAFPGPLPDSSLRDDVKGLGAILYLLLTGHWSLPGGPEGIPMAPMGQNGRVVPPHALVPAVPADLSLASVRSIEDTSIGGIRTSAALMNVLQQVSAAETATELMAPIEDGEDDDGTIWTTRKPVQDADRRKKLAIGVTLLAVATVGILAWVGMQLISFFSDDSGPTGGPTAVVNQQTQAPKTTANKPAPPKPAGPIQPGSLTEYNIQGTDNPNRASRALDGDPGSSWKTSTYRQQLPAYKPGIGLIASFADTTKLAQITIDTPSEGTVVEIRTADSGTPDFEATKVIATATLKNGHNEITLPSGTKAQHVVIWLTKLGETDKGFVSELTEVTFQRAG